MTPQEQERFIETLLACVHEALAQETAWEVHIHCMPPQPPEITRLPPVLLGMKSSHYRRLYGMSLQEMAQTYHRSVTTVWGWLRRGWRPK